MEFKIYSLYGAVFGTQGPAAERKILTRRKILAAHKPLLTKASYVAKLDSYFAAD